MSSSGGPAEAGDSLTVCLACVTKSPSLSCAKRSIESNVRCKTRSATSKSWPADVDGGLLPLVASILEVPRKSDGMENTLGNLAWPKLQLQADRVCRLRDGFFVGLDISCTLDFRRPPNEATTLQESKSRRPRVIEVSCQFVVLLIGPRKLRVVKRSASVVGITIRLPRQRLSMSPLCVVIAGLVDVAVAMVTYLSSTRTKMLIKPARCELTKNPRQNLEPRLPGLLF